MLAFFACLIILLLLASRLFLEITGAEAKNGYRSRNTVYWDLEQEKKNSLDILVLGNSEAFASFSPMELWLGGGIPSYLASIRTHCSSRHMRFILIWNLERQMNCCFSRPGRMHFRSSGCIISGRMPSKSRRTNEGSGRDFG